MADLNPSFLEEYGPGIGLGAVSALGSYWSNKQNTKLSRENRAFQERMSSTAYQRSMADMKKAGLNPMLAYMKGGASTPGTSFATMQNPLEGVSNTAMQYRTQRANLKLLQEQTRNTKNSADSKIPTALIGQAAERVSSSAKNLITNKGVIKSNPPKNAKPAYTMPKRSWWDTQKSKLNNQWENMKYKERQRRNKSKIPQSMLP